MRQDNRACREVYDLSCRISRWLFRQPGVGEESLTDWFLYEMADRLPFVYYLKFTRHQEARESGADWEWWFVGRKQSLGLRVQAKRLSGASDHYRLLAYTNAYGLQIETFMDSAKRADLLPFYAFYHGTPEPPPIRCKDYPEVGRWEGVFLASATELHEKFIVGPRIKVESSDLLGMSDALSGLFCARSLVRSTRDAVEGIYEYLAHYFPGMTQEGANSRRGLHRELPQYVGSLLELDNRKLPEWWEGEYAKDIELTKAIVVFDMREY